MQRHHHWVSDDWDWWNLLGLIAICLFIAGFWAVVGWWVSLAF